MELGGRSAVPAEAGFLVGSSVAVLAAANPIRGGTQWLQSGAYGRCTRDIAFAGAGGMSVARLAPGLGVARVAMPGPSGERP